MDIQENILNKGDFKTLYSALVDASKKIEYSNFILNDTIENFVYLKFLFDNVDEIKIFVERIDYLVDVYNDVTSNSEFTESEDRQQVVDNFWKAFEQYCSNTDKKLLFVYRENITRALPSSQLNKIKDLLSLDNSIIQTKVLNHDLTIVEGLNFFILVPKYNMVLTMLKIEGKIVHVCHFHNDSLYEAANEIYEAFVCCSKELELKQKEGDE